MKRCSHPECLDALKPASEFYARKGAADGLQSWCKDCSRRARKAWAANNGDRLRELHRETHARRQADPERSAIERDRKREWERRARGSTQRRRIMLAPQKRSPTVPVGPFAAWLRTLGDSTEQMALRAHMAPRHVWAMFNDRATVEVDTVDRALLAVGDGTTIDSLYPNVSLDRPLAA